MTYKFITLNAYTNYLENASEAEGYLISSRVGDFPIEMKERIIHCVGGPDIYTPIKKGKDWLYELTLIHQPKTGKIFLRGKDLNFSIELGGLMPLFYLLQEVNGRLIIIYRNFFNQNPSDPYYLDKKIDDRIDSLPLEIREAYYNRFDGLSIPSRACIERHGKLLPKPSDEWLSIDMYLSSVRLKKHLPLFEEWFPDIKPKEKGYPYIKFMMFLDSRPLSSGKIGDVFFIKTDVQDGVIYYIRDADVEKMRILKDPVEAIDSYCEHVLLGKEGRFDFLPYSCPFLVKR